MNHPPWVGLCFAIKLRSLVQYANFGSGNFLPRDLPRTRDKKSYSTRVALPVFLTGLFMSLPFPAAGHAQTNDTSSVKSSRQFPNHMPRCGESESAGHKGR